LLGEDGRFWVLALSQKNVRLLRCTRDSVEPVVLPPSVPTSSAEALNYEEEGDRRGSEIHTAPGGHPVMREVAPHGQRGAQGSSVRGDKDVLLPYPQPVNTNLQPLLQPDGPPLVLATAEPLLSMYRQVNSYRNLLPEAIEGHPDRLGDREL